MGSSIFPEASTAAAEVVLKGWAATASGRYTLAAALDAGVYRIELDSTQTLSIGLGTTDSNTFYGTIRGGSGHIVCPVSVANIVLPAGTYPFSVTITKMNVTQLAAPVVTSVTWASDKLSATGNWSSIPGTATGMTLFWQNGGIGYSADFSSTTTGATATIPAGNRPSTNAGGIPVVVAAKVNGINGLGQTITTGAVPAVTATTTYTSSGSFVAPFTGTLTQLLVVAGGGSGGSGSGPNIGGGGGAGGYRNSTTFAVTSGTTYTVTVGTGGPGISGTTGRNSGTPSAFGSLSATGGGGGGFNTTAGLAGGSGGGGGGTGSPSGGSSGGSGNAGGYSPVEGFSGGSSVNDYPGGGGGGAGGAGGSNNGVAGVGVANSITGTSVTYAPGGPGRSPGNASLYGGGGGGSAYNGSSSGAGYQGIVIVKYSF